MLFLLFLLLKEVRESGLESMVITLDYANLGSRSVWLLCSHIYNSTKNNRVLCNLTSDFGYYLFYFLSCV